MARFPGSIGNGAMREPGGSAVHAFTVTPGSSALAMPTSGLYVDVTGDVEVTMLSGTSVTFHAVPAGVTLPIRVSHVTSGTSATVIALV